MKKIILALTLAFLSTSLFAVGIKIIDKKSRLYNEIDQTYDIQKSWWWYEEEIPVVDKNGTTPVKKIEKVKYKVTPAEHNQLKMMSQLIKTNQDVVKELKKMNATLDYNFPRRFEKWTTNKKTGEKCLANSSADCYVPILIPEAQQVPAMAAFLKKPNMKNAKNYLGWQSAHFNHVMKVGYGLSFAYKQFGKNAYKTSSILETASPLGYASKARVGAKVAMLQKFQNHLHFYIFLGKTEWLENRMQLKRIGMTGFGGFEAFDNFDYVFLTQKRMKEMDEALKKLGGNIFDKYKKRKHEVDTKLFKKFKIELTPTVVVVFDDGKGNQIWQKLGHDLGYGELMTKTFDFLEYNGVLNPENVDEAVIAKLKSYQLTDKNVLDADAAGMQIKMNDLNMDNVDESQILKRAKKGKKNEK